MSEQFEEVIVNLANQKALFTSVSKSNPERPVVFDYKAPLGDGQSYNVSSQDARDVDIQSNSSC